MTKEEIAEQFQKECNQMVTEAVSRSAGPGITAQDGYNAYYFMKMGEFELRLRKLEETAVRKLPD